MRQGYRVRLVEVNQLSCRKLDKLTAYLSVDNESEKTLFKVSAGRQYAFAIHINVMSGHLNGARLMSVLGNRTRQRRQELKLSQKTLADRLGVKQTSVYLVESGATESPRFLLALAAALDTTPQWLLGKDEQALDDTISPIEPVALVGYVQGDATQPAPEWPQERWQWLLWRRDPRFPGVKRRLFEVRGDSFDEVYPHGTLVAIADYGALGLKPQAGHRCIIANFCSEGVEMRIKEILGRPGALWLRSRSSNQLYAAETWALDSFAGEIGGPSNSRGAHGQANGPAVAVIEAPPAPTAPTAQNLKIWGKVVAALTPE